MNIYKHVEDVRGKRNSKGSVYFISNQLPEPYAEQKRQMKQLVKEHREQPKPHCMNMKWSKNKQLIVNNELYKKQITSPTTKDLRVDEEIKGRMRKIELVKGDQIVRGVANSWVWPTG